jgi:hypothetical protein
VVSFKLETDLTELEEKANRSLRVYQCDAVVANLLSSYQAEVVVYRRGAEPHRLRDNGGNLDEQLGKFLISLCQMSN